MMYFVKCKEVTVKGSIPTPEMYEQWLRGVVQRCASRNTSEQLIFVNAWNEWAEGNHLEPCRKWGHAYLEATRRALHQNGETNPR